MGLIGRALGGDTIASAGEAAEGISEVFVANATRRMELDHEAYAAALATAAEEYRNAGTSVFDRIVNGLNRLPRPCMALGTIGLFVFAMVDPAAFSGRMAGLAAIPEPLWWLLGAVVGFYFGARELHYRRMTPVGAPLARAGAGLLGGILGRARRQAPAETENAALADWARRR